MNDNNPWYKLGIGSKLVELYEAFPFFLAPKRILILQALPQVLSELD